MDLLNVLLILFAGLTTLSAIYIYRKYRRLRKGPLYAAIVSQETAHNNHDELTTLLKKIADNIPHSYISIIESDYTIGYTAGQEFAKAGLDPKRFIGMRLSDVFGEKTDFVRKFYEKTFQGEECFFEMTMGQQPQEYRTVPLRSDDGSIPQILVVVENITKRRERELEYAQILKTSIDGVWVLDMMGNLLEVNESAANMLGYTQDELLKLRVTDIDIIDSKQEVHDRIRRLTTKGFDRIETRHKRKDGRAIYVDISASFFPINDGIVVAFIRDISDRKLLESEREITIQLLNNLNKINETHDFMSKITRLMQEWSGCEAVGIRLKEGDDYPYFETRGFAHEFVVAESSLCRVNEQGNIVRDSIGNPILECMCGNVINGHFDSSKPFFTKCGSFWTNSTSDLLASTSEEDRQGRTRNRCNGEGYESVALIPLRYGDERLGLLQFNDSRRNRFNHELIQLFERLAANLCIGLIQRKSAQSLRESEEKFRELAETIKDVFWICAPDWKKIWYISPAYEEVWGKSRQSLYDKPESWLDSVHPDDKSRLVDTIQRRSGGDFDSQDFPEYRIIRPDGTLRTILARSFPVYDRNGTVVRVAGIAEDITERKEVEEALREASMRQKAAVKAGNVGLWEWDLATNKVRFSAEWKNQIGYRDDEIGDAFNEWESRVHPDDIGPTKKHIERCISEIRQDYRVEFRLKHKDGAYRWMLAQASVEADAKGQPIKMRGSHIDITESKLAEAALRESEDKLRNIIEHSSNLFYSHTAEHQLTYLSPQTKEFFDCEPEEALVHWTDFATDNPINELGFAKTLKAIETGVRQQSYELELVGRKGRKIRVEVNEAPIVENGKVTAIVGALIDITARKQAEQSLEKEKEKYQSIFETAASLIISVDNMGIVHECNSRIKEVLGFDKDEVIGRSMATIIHPDYVEVAKQSLMETMTTGISRDNEYKMIKKTGELIDVRINSAGIKLEADSFDRTICIVEDITVQKQAAEVLRKSEETLRAYISSAPYAIFVSDKLGQLIDVNEAACTLTGYAMDELLKLSIIDLAAESSSKKAFIEYVKIKETKPLKTETRLRRKDDSALLVSLDGVRLSDNRYMAFCMDITEKKRLQELESRAQRLEMAGSIAGQVAHDFNNLLAPIMAYPEFIREELSHDNIAHAYLDSIESAAKNIANINQDLVTMGRRGHFNQHVIDLNRILLQAVREMESRADHVKIDLNLCADLMKIKGGAAQIHRAISNLIANAQDAVHDNGVITVTSENYYADETSVAFGRIPKGEYVKITIADNGCGIDEDVMQNIFDPFFTTKTADKKRGSGLGLSVVDAVMKDHDGYLDLYSDVNHGTAFYLYFPMTREVSRDVIDDKLKGGNESVLVVDDDRVQREVSTQLLKRLGYTVYAVTGGEQAVEFLQETPCDLVVLDMVMPSGIDGTETYRRILEIYPNQKAVILSGFSESDRVQEAQKLGAGEFVKKPVTRSILATAVRNELDRVVRDSAK
ncbi:MAG: PAS domain S-box protein [Candidatus Zixiibacteriota bacterium]